MGALLVIKEMFNKTCFGKDGPSLPLQQCGRQAATIGAAAQSPSHGNNYSKQLTDYKFKIPVV